MHLRFWFTKSIFVALLNCSYIFGIITHYWIIFYDIKPYAGYNMYVNTYSPSPTSTWAMAKKMNNAIRDKKNVADLQIKTVIELEGDNVLYTIGMR